MQYSSAAVGIVRFIVGDTCSELTFLVLLFMLLRTAHVQEAPLQEGQQETQVQAAQEDQTQSW